MISLILILNIIKVHRNITTIDVENDNSITSVKDTKLYPNNNDIPLAVTNIITNGRANDIKQVYDSISGRRLVIASKLKGIACHIDESLNSHKRDEITDDNTTNEINDDGLI